MYRRIHILKFTPSDFDKYYQLVGNEKVMAMITERAIPIDEAKCDYNLLLRNNSLHGSFGSFVVYEKSNFVGLAKLEVMEENSREAEIGYMLLPEYWGKGLGSQIVRLLLEKAKSENVVKRLKAIIDPNNIPSRKILINNGFISEEVGMMDGLPGEILSLELKG